MERDEVPALLRPMHAFDDVDLAEFDAAMERKNKPLLDRMQELDIATYLPEDILTKVDRASMLVSLEVRVPFLDHRLIEFASRLPQSLRTTPETGKILERTLAYQRLHRQVIDRPKKGFSVPLVHWFRGPLLPFLRTHLLGPDSVCREFLDMNMVRTCLSEYEAGKSHLSTRLWLFLMFEFWCRSWLTGSARACR